MKTTKRGKLLMLACAALVAVLACLPLLWFRAQDARMFGTVNQSSGLYESREVSGDDFYLLQQVKNRTQMHCTDWMVSAGLDGTAALYTPAGSSRYNMTSSDTATDFAASLLTQLHDADVLPDTWYHVAADNLSSYSSGELYILPVIPLALRGCCATPMPPMMKATPNTTNPPHSPWIMIIKPAAF